MSSHSPSSVYNLFITLRLHFTDEKFNAVKYHFKLRAAPDINKAKDKYTFQKLAKHPDPQGLILSNISIKPNIWVRELFTSESQTCYRKWKKYQESLTYSFQDDISKLNSESFKVVDNQHPELLKLYVGGEIAIDTVCILDVFLRFLDYWDKELQSDLVWKEMRLPLKKYKAFLVFDREKVKEIIKEKLINTST